MDVMFVDLVFVWFVVVELIIIIFGDFWLG